MEIYVAFLYKNIANLQYNYNCKKKIQTNFRNSLNFARFWNILMHKTSIEQCLLATDIEVEPT